MLITESQIKKIIRQCLLEINRRSFLKGAASLCALGVQSACQQDYELHNYPSINLGGMRPPDCLGKINLLFLHHDFEDGPIPEDFFFETYKELESDGKVEVTKDRGDSVGFDSRSDIDYAIRVLFKNVPEASSSWDDYGLRTWLNNNIANDGGPFHLQGEPFLIRSFAFYFPVLNGMVYANTDHIRCETTGYQASCNNWHREGNWRLIYPIPVQQEDSTCEGLYRYFMQGPLQNPEKELENR